MVSTWIGDYQGRLELKKKLSLHTCCLEALWRRSPWLSCDFTACSSSSSMLCASFCHCFKLNKMLLQVSLAFKNVFTEDYFLKISTGLIPLPQVVSRLLQCCPMLYFPETELLLGFTFSVYLISFLVMELSPFRYAVPHFFFSTKYFSTCLSKGSSF